MKLIDSLKMMGIPKLNAIAQNQKYSPAPPYMVISALKALLDREKGMQQPLPKGTIKDQLVAQTSPPAGIAQLQQPQPPVVGMSGGGPVKHFSGEDGVSQVESDEGPSIMRLLGPLGLYGGAKTIQTLKQIASLNPGDTAWSVAKEIAKGGTSKIPDALKLSGVGATLPKLGALGALAGTGITSFSTPTEQYRKRFGMETDDPSLGGDLVARGLGAASDLGDAMTFGYASKFYEDKKAQRNPVPKTAATAATSNPNPDFSNEGTRRAGGTPPPIAAPDAGTRERITASAASRGVGSVGKNPLAIYQQMAAGRPPSDFNLDIPKHQQLLDAHSKYSMPDAARMQELKDAESRAGLGAFARGMLGPGRGFGAVFGRAAADANDAQEVLAERRRNWLDKREDTARELGIKVGDLNRQDALAQVAYKDSRSDKDFEQKRGAAKDANEATGMQNRDTLQMRELEIRAEANRVAAASAALQKDIRMDGLTQQKLLTLVKLKDQALQNANAQATLQVKNNLMSATLTPDKQDALIQQIAEPLYRQQFSTELEKMLNAALYQSVGVKAPTAAPASTNPNVRGRIE